MHTPDNGPAQKRCRRVEVNCTRVVVPTNRPTRWSIERVYLKNGIFPKENPERRTATKNSISQVQSLSKDNSSVELMFLYRNRRNISWIL